MLLLVIFIALELILSFIPTPLWGLRQGPPSTLYLLPAATLNHLPVVLAGALLGPWAGGIVGAVAGVSRVIDLAFLSTDSFSSAMYAPFYLTQDGSQFIITGSHGPFRFPLLSLMTSLIPPIVAGLLAAFLVRVLRQILRGNWATLALAGAGGATASAVLVWLLASLNYGSFGGLLLDYLRINGPFEVLLAALVCGVLGTLLYRRFIANN